MKIKIRRMRSIGRNSYSNNIVCQKTGPILFDYREVYQARKKLEKEGFSWSEKS